MSGSTPPLLEDPLGHLLQRLRSAAQQRIVVGIVGLPGAGKSTLARWLADAVNQAEGEGAAMALGMDGFHLTRAQLRAFPDPVAALARRGAPWTFDPQALRQRLQQVRDAKRSPQSGPVGWPGFEHGVGDPVPDALWVQPQLRLVLLEGLYLLHEGDGWALRDQMDSCWFLDTPLEVALQRLSLRHQKSWGVTADAATRRIDANDRPNALTVLRTRPLADAVIEDTPACMS